MRRGVAEIVAVLATLALSSPVWAQDVSGRAETVAVLDSIIDGVPPNARPDFQRNLEESLRGAGFTVLPMATVKNLLLSSDATAGCSFGPCLRQVGKALGVELGLVARISAVGPSFTFVLTLVDTQSGAPVAQVSDSCAVCTFDEASSAATLAVVDLGMRYRDARDQAVQAARLLERERHENKRVQAARWVMAGIAVLAGGTAAYLLLGRSDADTAGWVTAGGAAGLAIGTLATF